MLMSTVRLAHSIYFTRTPGRTERSAEGAESAIAMRSPLLGFVYQYATHSQDLQWSPTLMPQLSVAVRFVKRREW